MIRHISAKLHHILFKPVPAHSIALFRIAMGALLLFESVNYGIFLCLDCMYRKTELLFKYQYFDWVVLPEAYGIELLLFVMGVASLGVMLGFMYRVSVVLLTICFAVFFLLDKALYLNHYYLTLLFLGILCFVPANRVWALDVKRSQTSNHAPYIGNWSRVWLIAQLEIVLIYAGVVKLNSDWLHLEPLRLWMTARSADEGPLLQWLTADPGIALAAYGVILLHILGAPLLLMRRTRLPIFLLYLVFHCINALVFDIGIFPFMTAAATTLIFAPDWPLKLWHRILGVRSQKCNAAAPGTIAAEVKNTGSNTSWHGVAIIGLMGVWITVQVILPTRPLWYAGSVAWNEAGHQFSWRMKLRDKRGETTFVVKNIKTGQSYRVNPATRLSKVQARKLSCNPDLIWQFSQYLLHEALQTFSALKVSVNDIEVTADASCSLNTRPVQKLIKPIDLTKLDRNAPRLEWVMPMNEPLPKHE